MEKFNERHAHTFVNLLAHFISCRSISESVKGEEREKVGKKEMENERCLRLSDRRFNRPGLRSRIASIKQRRGRVYLPGRDQCASVTKSH